MYLSEGTSFSALQRAEIAEILQRRVRQRIERGVSVLFNEPKLLKCAHRPAPQPSRSSFSALQRAEIAEIDHPVNADAGA